MKWVIQGTWDEMIEGSKVLSVSENSRGKTVYETGPTVLMWKRHTPPLESKPILHLLTPTSPPISHLPLLLPSPYISPTPSSPHPFPSPYFFPPPYISPPLTSPPTSPLPIYLPNPYISPHLRLPPIHLPSPYISLPIHLPSLHLHLPLHPSTYLIISLLENMQLYFSMYLIQSLLNIAMYANYYFPSPSPLIEYIIYPSILN